MSSRACTTEKIGPSQLLPLHILEAAILNFDRIFNRVLPCFPEFPRVGLSHGGRRRRRVLGRAGDVGADPGVDCQLSEKWVLIASPGSTGC